MHKVQHKPINIQVRDPIWKEQKGLEYAVVWRTGLFGVPPHSVQSLGSYKVEPATLGKMQARSAIIHRTVWCATGLSGEPAGNDYPARNGRHWQELQCNTVCIRSQRAPDCPVWHQTVRCRKRTKLQGTTRLRTLMVGWHGGATDTEQCLSSAPIASSLPNGYGSGWGL
jgi:hypothetical protein